MYELLQYGLTLVGLVYIVSQSFIFRPIRLLASNLRVLEVLIYCPSCTGFWVGLLLWKLGYYPFHVKIWLLEPGCVGCALGALWATYGGIDAWSLDRGAKTDG
jgi:hypothetical protein